jgi:hypothetical protein
MPVDLNKPTDFELQGNRSVWVKRFPGFQFRNNRFAIYLFTIAFPEVGSSFDRHKFA